MTQTPKPLKTGFHPMEQCARGLSNCQSLLQIVSTAEERTITCCGEVLDEHTPEPNDRWSICIRSASNRGHCAGVDLRIFVDRQDISHIAAVTTYARALIDSADHHNPAYNAAIEWKDTSHDA